MVIYLWYLKFMKRLYTIVRGLFFVFSLVVCNTALLPVISAQDCTPVVSYIMVLPTEQTIDGVLYKRVQVVINNPKPGPAGRFYFTFDGAARDENTKTYEYGYNTEVFLVPVNVEKITFYDVNNFSCFLDYYPELVPNKCSFRLDQYIDLSAGDCYNRTVTYRVPDHIVIDSVVWLRNGSNIPVHDQMSWVNIPPGSYEITFFDENGCEASTNLSTCTTRKDAGRDGSDVYCLDQDETINLYSLLSDGVDSGGFYTHDFMPLDSLEVLNLSYDAVGTHTYFYVAPATLDIPDTSRITIEARDCSECLFTLISAERNCTQPEYIEVNLGGGSPTDTTFELTLPDGSTSTRVFYTPFDIHFPNFQDTLDLVVSWETLAGSCDSIIQIFPLADPTLVINATEVDLPGDSVAIEVSVSQGTAPYQLDILLGTEQTYVNLNEDDVEQLHFLQSSDTAILVAMDALGCSETDTLILTPDCLRPIVEVIQDSCGTGNGRIVLDQNYLPEGATIRWEDTSQTGLWERGQLTPGTYQYTVNHGDCEISDVIVLEKLSPDIPLLVSRNDCLLDGKIEVLIPDSNRVLQWSLGGTSIPTFSASFPANQELNFEIETIEGCIGTLLISEEETPWLQEVKYNEVDEMTAALNIEPSRLLDYGWSVNDSLLCNPCVTFRSADPKPGVYVFHAEQFAGCRQEVVLIVEEPSLSFLMPNVITPTGSKNRMLQIFDPQDQMASVVEFQVFDRFGNVLFQKSDFLPDDDATINWPNGSSTELPNVIICVARIVSKSGEEVTLTQDVLILR